MKGFTLLELLIVVAISAMVSSLALVYSSIGRNEIALTVETSKIAQVILQAKNLALSTYNINPQTCGFGVSFNIAAQTYSIFAYTPTNHPPEHGIAPPCPDDSLASTSPIFADEMLEYSEGTWKIPVSQGVKLENGSAGDTLQTVLFYPPAPSIYISRQGGGGVFLNQSVQDVTSNVYLATVDGKATAEISVNGAGQINF